MREVRAEGDEGGSGEVRGEVGLCAEGRGGVGFRERRDRHCKHRTL